jgi:hypothetical protein
MVVVVMFEPAIPGENLSLSGQVNEVFGPFETEAEADEWVERATGLIKDRQWLVIPLRDKSSLNAVDPLTN